MESKVTFVPFELSKDESQLISFLTSERWPFHLNETLTNEKVLKFISDGHFSGTDNACFWVQNTNGIAVGFIRVFDMDDIGDGYPMFDLRVKSAFRKQGFGESAVRWMTQYLFKKYPKLDRIGGTTRVDNIAMRKTFEKCNFVKEGHYRQSWESKKESYDAVFYAVLRKDWETNTTTQVDWNT